MVDSTDWMGWGPQLLLFVRVWSIVRAQVLWQRLVGPMWWLVAVAPAVVIAASVPLAGSPAPTGGLMLAVGVELVVGTVIGLIATLPGYALLGAGAQLERALGLERLRSRALSFTVTAVSVALGLQAGVHQPLLLALRDGARLFPPGSVEVWASLATDGLAFVGPAIHGATVLGLALAAPALLAAAVAELALRLMGAGPRPAAPGAAPLAPWARMAAGLVALGAALATYPGAWVRALG